MEFGYFSRWHQHDPIKHDKWDPSSEFVSSSIPSWQILTAHAQPFRGARDLAFCLKVPLDSLLVWASSGGSGETAPMRRLAWTFAARRGYKYQMHVFDIKKKNDIPLRHYNLHRISRLLILHFLAKLFLQIHILQSSETIIICAFKNWLLLFFRFFEVWMKNLITHGRVQLGCSFIPQRNEKKWHSILKLIFLLDFLHKFNLIGAIKC